MNAVERLCEYDALPEEAPTETPVRARLPPGWPRTGALDVRSLTMSHRPGLAPALRGVSFAAGAGLRVGVCGRTGSGKSSLFAALLRLSEPSAGAVFLDGVDTRRVGLSPLRRAVALVPQASRRDGKKGRDCESEPE